MFIKGTSTSQTVSSVIADLYALKKPDALLFSKRNDLRPFEGGTSETSLEFFSHRNDSSLAVFGSHSKKRPNNLTFIRMFDYHILDMVEVGVTDYLSIGSIKGPACAVGIKPCFMFCGHMWEQNPSYKLFQNILLDFFRGTIVEDINLSGLETVFMVTADDEGRIYFRVYKILMKKSGTKLPRVELELMGPSIDMKLGRVRAASDQLMKHALKVPKELAPKKVKNIATNALGETVGRIHMQKQDFDSLQSRKVKALKKRKHEEQSQSDEKSEQEEN